MNDNHDKWPMKKTIFLFTICAAAAFAENDRLNTAQSIYSQYPNQIFAGPNVICIPDNNVIREAWGMQLGYEYQKPEDVYNKIDIFSSCPGGNYQWHFVLNMASGYTFLFDNSMVTPFVGGTLMGPFSHYCIFGYFSGGIRTLTPILPWLDLGCDFAVFAPTKEPFFWYQETALRAVLHSSDHCDLQIEPYFANAFEFHRLNFGLRFLVGKRF